MAGKSIPGAISHAEWRQLLSDYVSEPPSEALIGKLEKYLTVLLRWNARMNLTSVREPQEIVRRHVGESLFLAAHVPRGTASVLDHGSGAGFPGLILALARPEVRVTLSECQTKKQSFLREAIRFVSAPNCELHPGRTEDMPLNLQFDLVVMRAVDNASSAYPAGLARVKAGGRLIVLEGANSAFLRDRLVSEVPIPAGVGFLRCYESA